MKKIFLFFLAIEGIVFFSSCRDNNFDWDSARKEQRVAEYEKSFKSIFGDIKPDQSWDFSTSGNASATRATFDFDAKLMPQRIKLESFDPSSYNANLSKISDPTVGGLGPNVFNQLSSGFFTPTDLQSLTLKVKGPMCICPIWHATFLNDYYLFIEYYNDDETVDPDYCYLLNKDHFVKAINNKKFNNWDNSTSMSSSDYNNGQGGNKGYLLTFPSTEKDHIVKISTIEKVSNEYFKQEGLVGSKSFNSLIASQTGGTYSGAIFFDSDGQPSTNPDWDDLVCLFAYVDTQGEGFPAFDQPGESKRYMVEDLGATAQSDIDFNDIVVDFKLNNHMEYNTTSKSYEVTKSSLSVYLYALGGTLDFTLKVGGKEIFKKSAGSSAYSTAYNNAMVNNGFNVKTMYNTGSAEDGIKPAAKLHYDQWLCKIEGDNSGTGVTNPIGWIPSGTGANNISIVVESNTFNDVETDINYNASTEKYEISFPAEGTVPAIIAFDVDKQWRLERDGITSVECQSGSEYNWFSPTDPRK